MKYSALFHNIHWGSAALGITTPLIIIGGYNVFWSNTNAQEIVGEIVTVGRKDIVLSLKELGTVTLANEQQMRFNVQGKIEKVHVKTGDMVKRDDLIAELEKTDPNSDIRQAQLAVNDAYLRLQELQASRDQEILSAQNSVRTLERQMENAYGEVPSQKMQVNDAIDKAKRTVLEKEAAYEKAQRDLSSSIENSLTNAESLLDDIIKILSGDNVIRGSKRYNIFEVDFLYNDYNAKNKTEFAYYDAVNSYDDFRGKHGSLIDVSDTRKLQKALDDAILIAQNIVNLADVSYDFLKTAVPQDYKYTDTELNALKSLMIAKKTSAMTLLDSLRDQLALLTLPSKSIAYYNLENAKESLALLESEKKNGTTALETAERSIDELNDKLRVEQQKLVQTNVSVDVQINQQKNALAQKQVALDKAKRALENYELRAPFDGIVRKVDFQVGDNLLADAGETKYVVLENPAYFIVTVQLDQVDIVNIKEEQKANITFDALSDVTLEGKVYRIDTTPIQTSGVVSYEVEIILDPVEGYTILSGMTAKVEIHTASAESALVVPNLALRSQGQKTFVTDDAGNEKLVETGITDGTYTEILSGLQYGDKIQSISFSLNSNTSASNTTGTNARGGMMMMGDGPPR